MLTIIFLETSTGETKEKMKDVESDVLDIQDSEMDKSNIGTSRLCCVHSKLEHVTVAFLQSKIFEPPCGKTNNVVSDQVRHKPACTVSEKS